MIIILNKITKDMNISEIYVDYNATKITNLEDNKRNAN